jgi:uncharacterized membrane protein
MAVISGALNAVILGISLMGALVVVWGVAEAFIGFLAARLGRRAGAPGFDSEPLRRGLGRHLLLGLEIFIAGDIIASVASPSWDRVGILAAIVAIRTVLSYFLGKEVRQG